MVWIPRGFPSTPPHCFVTPTRGIIPYTKTTYLYTINRHGNQAKPQERRRKWALQYTILR